MEISVKARALEAHELAVAYYSTSEKYGYKFLMEVKKIRDEKLYKNLGFTDFDSYTTECFGYSRETITNRIQTAEEFGDEYDEALRHFGQTKTRQIAQLPDIDRQKMIDWDKHNYPKGRRPWNIQFLSFV